MNALVQLTPNGRVPGTPLRRKKWEIIAQETVAGKTCEECGEAAGIKAGPGRKGNVARIRQYPIVRERIGEISARSAELAEIHDGWILARCALLARSAVSRFFRRDPVTGEVMQNKHGFPMFDFQRASEDELQMLKAISLKSSGGGRSPRVAFHNSCAGRSAIHSFAASRICRCISSSPTRSIICSAASLIAAGKSPSGARRAPTLCASHFSPWKCVS